VCQTKKIVFNCFLWWLFNPLIYKHSDECYNYIRWNLRISHNFNPLFIIAVGRHKIKLHKCQPAHVYSLTTEPEKKRSSEIKSKENKDAVRSFVYYSDLLPRSDSWYIWPTNILLTRQYSPLRYHTIYIFRQRILNLHQFVTFSA